MKLQPASSLLGSSYKCCYGTAGMPCPSVANIKSSNNARRVACYTCPTMPRNSAMLNFTALYSNVSPSRQLTWPTDVVLKSIFIPYPRKSNIHCIGLPHPRTINPSIIFRTHSKLLLPLFRLPSLLSVCALSLSYPLSSNSHGLRPALNSSCSPVVGYANRSACCTIMKWATLITADNIDGYVSAPRNPRPLGLTPNAANPQTNAMSYSRL